MSPQRRSSKRNRGEGVEGALGREEGAPSKTITNIIKKKTVHFGDSKWKGFREIVCEGRIWERKKKG